jgi:thiol-disulfide isomerase/thioredoxin
MLGALLPVQAAESVWTKFVGDTLYDADGNKKGVDALEGKYVGLYFSASWCGPCRAFTPELQAFHKKFSSNFEVVLVGADRNEKSHFKYMKGHKMKWLSVPFGSDVSNTLNRGFEVTGIPTLVLIDPQGKVITRDGRQAVMESKPLLEKEGDTLAVNLEPYMCGSCSKEHKRLVFDAVN